MHSAEPAPEDHERQQPGADKPVGRDRFNHRAPHKLIGFRRESLGGRLATPLLSRPFSSNVQCIS